MENTPINPFLELPHPAADSLSGMPLLPFDETLLTKKEREILAEAWDGDAVIDWESPHFKNGRTLTVAVHSGEPHGDDVGAVALLQTLLRDVEIRWFRSRDPQRLANADLRIDVGFGLLDHHGPRADKGHGIAAITRVYQLLLNSLGDQYPRLIWERLAEVVDRLALADVGLIDFSYAPWLNAAVLAQRSAAGWSCGGDGSDPTEDALFGRLVERMRDYMEDVFRGAVAAHNATEIAMKDIEASGSDVVVFSAESRLAPCKEILWKQDHTAWYYVSQTGKDHWVVNCTCDPKKPFSQKGSWHLFPRHFRGMNEVQLKKLIGCPDGTDVFVHADGFVAGFPTRDAAVKFAQLCCKEGGWGS